MTAEQIGVLRDDCFDRDGGRCVKCGVGLFKQERYEGDPRGYHMAHKGNKRMWGDSLENVQAECGDCHIVKFHTFGPTGEKPCPPKGEL